MPPFFVNQKTKAMKRQPLDIYEKIPAAQRAYLSNYGWHFNKAVCDFAVKQMRRDINGKPEKIEPWSKDQVDDLLQRNNITLQNNTGYDYVYVANMCKADFLKKSIPDDAHAAMYVRDVIDDIDAADGNIMRKWYACQVGNGEAVEWEDFI